MRILEFRDGSHVPIDVDAPRSRRRAMPSRSVKKRGRDDDEGGASTTTTTAASKKRRAATSTGTSWARVREKEGGRWEAMFWPPGY